MDEEPDKTGEASAQGKPVERLRSMTLGIVIERQPTGNRWQPWRWKAVAVEPGLVVETPWTLLAEQGEVRRYLAASLTLELHRKETEGYRYNLSGQTPAVYVAMRPDGGEDFPIRPVAVSVSPSEAEAATEMGDDMVEVVAMSPALIDWVQSFVGRHHVDQPFFKRRRKGRDKALGDTSDFVELAGSRDGADARKGAASRNGDGDENDA